MTPTKRTRMSPDARRRQLIDEGLAMANEAPLDNVTIEAVAERVGVSRALIFHYFDTKQDFHVAIAREQSRRMLDRSAPDLGSDDPMEILRGTVEGFLDFVVENKGSYLALMRGSSSSDSAMRAVFDETRNAMVRRTLDNVGLAGLTATPTIELIVHGWLAFSEDIAMRWLIDPTIDREALLDLMTTSLPMLGLASGEIGLDAVLNTHAAHNAMVGPVSIPGRPSH